MRDAVLPILNEIDDEDANRNGDPERPLRQRSGVIGGRGDTDGGKDRVRRRDGEAVDEDELDVAEEAIQ